MTFSRDILLFLFRLCCVTCLCVCVCVCEHVQGHARYVTTHECAHIRRLEDVSVLLCHAPPYSLEIRSLLESGAKLAANKPQQSSCLSAVQQ